MKRPAKPKAPLPSAPSKATPWQLAEWRRCWGLAPSTSYIGDWMDPLPMPPFRVCQAQNCDGDLFWTEQQLPHRGWRCANCHPPPATIQIKHWHVDALHAAERDAIAAEAPERQPKPTQAEKEEWW